MLFQTRPKLEELLVESLAGQAALDVADLQRRLVRRGRRCSFQAVYKALAKLESVGVVVKAGRSFSLKFSWALEMVALAERIQNVQLESGLPDALPPSGESRIWHFTSLLKLDDYWAHLVLRLFHQTRGKTMYEWIPHPWFEMLHPAKEDQFREALRRDGRRLHMIIGGDTFLDHECSKRWAKDIYRYSFAEGPFDEQRAVYMDVLDDFILTLRLNPKVSRDIDGYFDDIDSFANLDVGGFLRLMTQSTPATIKLENNPTKAKKLRKKFTDYFGE